MGPPFAGFYTQKIKAGSIADPGDAGRIDDWMSWEHVLIEAGDGGVKTGTYKKVTGNRGVTTR